MSHPSDISSDAARLEIAPRNILHFLAANNGHLKSRSHLHKLCYLLQYCGIPELSHVYFTYDLYGPYSRELSEELHDSVIARFVTEIDHSDWKSGDLPSFAFSYELNQNGWEWYRSAEPSFDSRLKRMLDLLNPIPYEAIWLCCSVLFLREEYGRVQEEAFGKVLEANPALAPYSEEAVSLMVSLKS